MIKSSIFHIPSPSIRDQVISLLTLSQVFYLFAFSPSPHHFLSPGVLQQPPDCSSYPQSLLVLHYHQNCISKRKCLCVHKTFLPPGQCSHFITQFTTLIQTSPDAFTAPSAASRMPPSLLHLASDFLFWEISCLPRPGQVPLSFMPISSCALLCYCNNH